MLVQPTQFQEAEKAKQIVEIAGVWEAQKLEAVEVIKLFLAREVQVKVGKQREDIKQFILTDKDGSKLVCILDPDSAGR